MNKEILRTIIIQTLQEEFEYDKMRAGIKSQVKIKIEILADKIINNIEITPVINLPKFEFDFLSYLDLSIANLTMLLQCAHPEGNRFTYRFEANLETLKTCRDVFVGIFGIDPLKNKNRADYYQEEKYYHVTRFIGTDILHGQLYEHVVFDVNPIDKQTILFELLIDNMLMKFLDVSHKGLPCTMEAMEGKYLWRNLVSFSDSELDHPDFDNYAAIKVELEFQERNPFKEDNLNAEHKKN